MKNDLQYHPVIDFIYFGCVIGFGMVLMHPVCLGIGLVSAICCTVHFFGWNRAKEGFGFLAVLMVITAVMNPAFSHQGITVITYLPTGNVLTLESVLYGLAAACMLAETLLWFRIMCGILTTDKIVYLFGKGFPVLGLMLSMILGFIPKIQRKFREIRLAGQAGHQKELDMIAKKYNSRVFPNRIKAGFFIKMCRMRYGTDNLSILITWILEDAVEMADSMKGRGYGIEGRTSFTIYRFTKRDTRKLILLMAEVVYILTGILRGGISWDYYPETAGAGFGGYSVSIYIVYLLMCMAPVIETTAESGRLSMTVGK